MFNKIKKGFTLAEVVIVLVVMAFLASILTPTLIASNEQRVMLTSLKKNYEDLLVLQDAMNLEEVQHTKCNRLNITSEANFLNTIIGTTDTNGNSNNDGFIPQYLKTLRGTPRTDYNTKLNAAYNIGANPAVLTKIDQTTAATINDIIVLKNGAVWLPYYDTTKFMVIVDVNGVKSPNKVGRDIFYFTGCRNDDTGKWEIRPTEQTDLSSGNQYGCDTNDDTNCYTNGPKKNTTFARKACSICASKLLD